MGMNSAGEVHQAGMTQRNLLRAESRGWRFTNTHEGPCACGTGPRNCFVSVGLERGVGEMCVAVSELKHVLMVGNCRPSAE